MKLVPSKVIICHPGCDRPVSGRHSVYCFTVKCSIKREINVFTFRCPNHLGEWIRNCFTFDEAVEEFTKHMKGYHGWEEMKNAKDTTRSS